MGEVRPGNSGDLASGADRFHNQLHDLVQILPVGGKLTAQVVVLDVLQHQIPITLHFFRRHRIPSFPFRQLRYRKSPEGWIDVLPTSLGWCVVYFIVSYLLLCFGIALSNRCKLPIVPTDLFPRELAQITGLPYPRIKISFDAICLTVTAGMTFLFLGHLKGIGIGTVLAALTMGKVIGIMGAWLDRHFVFDIYHRKTKG